MNRLRAVRALLVAAACSAIPSILVAQQSDSSALASDSLIDVLRFAEQRHDYLRLTTASQSVYSGYVFQVEPDSQWVHIGARRAMLPAITRLELRHKERSGALLGSIVGAVVLGLAGYEWPARCDVYDEETRRAVEVPCDAGWPIGLAGFLSGGILGSLAGIAIDPGETRWEDVWRAQQEP